MSAGEQIHDNSITINQLQPLANGEIQPQKTEVARDEFGRWLPGSLPNPGGRPKSRLISEELKLQLEAEDPKGRTGAERVGGRLLDLTTDKDGYLALAAIKEVTDRVEGKAVQNTNVRGLIVMMPSDQALAEAFGGDEPE